MESRRKSDACANYPYSHGSLSSLSAYEVTGDAVSYGFGPHGSGKIDDGVKVEEGGDMQLVLDERVSHGDIIDGGNWTVECVYTPAIRQIMFVTN